jgi:hypothetical protein
LSVFLAKVCLLEGIMTAPYGASISYADQEMLDQIATSIPPLPWKPWRWTAYPSSFHARGGAFMYVGRYPEDDPGYSLYIGARTEHPLQFLRGIVTDDWEHVAF